MRVYILVICLIFISFSAHASEVSYELCIIGSLKTRLTLRTLNDKYLQEFKKADYVVLKSEEYGEFQIKIVPGTKNAEGVIPFSKWTILGIKNSGFLSAKPFANSRAKEQVIRDVELSRGLYLDNNLPELVTTKDIKSIFCRGETVQLNASKIPGKGIFALLLTTSNRFIGQYYRRPKETSSRGLISCGSYSGEAILYRVYFE